MMVKKANKSDQLEITGFPFTVFFSTSDNICQLVFEGARDMGGGSMDRGAEKRSVYSNSQPLGGGKMLQEILIPWKER